MNENLLQTAAVLLSTRTIFILLLPLGYAILTLENVFEFQCDTRVNIVSGEHAGYKYSQCKVVSCKLFLSKSFLKVIRVFFSRMPIRSFFSI